jgi:hypothetical protein
MPAKALPFHYSCASLQQWWNAKYDSPRLSDFENSQIYTVLGFITCSNGFAIRKTSQGTEICQGVVEYATVENGLIPVGSATFSKHQCYMR